MIFSICILISLITQGCNASTEPSKIPQTLEAETTETEEVDESLIMVNCEIHDKPNYDEYWKIAQESTDIDLGEYCEVSAYTQDEDYYALINYTLINYTLINYTSVTENYKYWVTVFVREDDTVNSISIDGWEL